MSRRDQWKTARNKDILARHKADMAERIERGKPLDLDDDYPVYRVLPGTTKQANNKPKITVVVKQAASEGCLCALCGYKENLPQDFNRWPATRTSPKIYPVTDNGKPDGRLRGFICAGCLRQAQGMRLYVQSLLAGIRVTEHAVQRLMERGPNEHFTPERAKEAIIEMYGKATPIKFKDPHTAERLLNNQMTPVQYLLCDSGLVLVVTNDDPPTVVTVERNPGKKLGRDFRFVE